MAKNCTTCMHGRSYICSSRHRQADWQLYSRDILTDCPSWMLDEQRYPDGIEESDDRQH